MPPQKIQLVLQGGGARLFALIAALEEIDAAVEKGRLEVTRIAGTSAGAIAGGLYAAGVSPVVMKSEFANLDLESVVALPKGPTLLPRRLAQWRHIYAMLKKVAKGHPIADDRPLKSTLDKILVDTLQKRNARLRDVRIPLVIVAADASDRRAIPYDSRTDYGEESLVRCMLDSAALPFFFRTARHDQQKLVLDGGLVENLPAERLLSSVDELGPILAVSFIEALTNTPRTPIELAKALLSISIDASVKKSKRLGNITLVDLDPGQVGTFDFVRAQRVLRGDDQSLYQNARRTTRDALAEIEEATGKLVGNTRWDGIDVTTSRQLIEIYRNQTKQRPFHLHLKRLIVVANSLLSKGEEDFGTRDVVAHEIEFSPSESSIDCIMARILVDRGGKPSNVYIQVRDEERERVPFIPVPIAALSEEDPEGGKGQEIYAIQISFTPPLRPQSARVPDKRYFLRTEFRLGGALSRLTESEDSSERPLRDYLISSIARADGAAEIVEIEVHIPETFADIECKSGDSDPTNSNRDVHVCKPLPPAALAKRQRRGHLQPFVWQAKNVPNSAAVVLEIRRL